MTGPATAVAAPSLALLGLEPLRAAIEYVRLRCTRRRKAPRGDGHPVVLFPGLCTDCRMVGVLGAWCESLGHPTRDWGRGFNTGPGEDMETWLDALGQELLDGELRQAAPATLIGWSLGGLYAREIAKLRPHRIRQVITIGTPSVGLTQATNASWLYRLANGRWPNLAPAIARRLEATPPVPTTAIYSRTDGIVAWRACRPAKRMRVDYVEVASSHLGLVCHVDVLRAIEDRLQRPVRRRVGRARRCSS